MYFTQISKDGEVLVPVPEFTFEDVKSLKDYNEAKNFRIELTFLEKQDASKSIMQKVV